MNATLSVMGLWKHYPNLFELFTVPDVIDVSVVVQNIIAECAELEVLYTEPNTLHDLIGLWCKSRKWAWDGLAATMYLDYNPIYNYDRTEEWTESGSGSVHGTGASSGTQEDSRTGYNSGLYQPAEKTVTEAETTSNSNSNHNNHHTGRMYGNIGVTTTMQMITEQRQLFEWDLIRQIVQEFKQHFCVLIY